MLENDRNPPQHLFVNEAFNTTHIRKQDVYYFLPTTVEGLQIIQEFLTYQKWAGLTHEENEQIAIVVECELARKSRPPTK